MSPSSLTAKVSKSILTPVERAIRRFEKRFTGARCERQPMHTVYGGGHLFTADTIGKLSKLALKSFDERAPDALALSRIFGISDSIASQVHDRIRSQIERAAIEDYRIDFEDGFGARGSDEEDRETLRAAGELSKALREGKMPPAFGIRIKALSGPTAPRALRTLDLFMSALDHECPLIVTLPKVRVPEEVAALHRALDALERKLKWKKAKVRIEIMLEAPQLLPRLEEAVAAADERCLGVHFGAYDYTSALGISASCQTLDHPACDRARLEMQAILAGKPVHLCDGASHRMPVGSPEEILEAWRESYRNVRRAIEQGIPQGWDLHPAQIPPRLVALHVFYRESLETAGARLKGYFEKAGKAGLTGTFFDDAASAQGVFRHFSQGIACGAIDKADLAPLGLEKADFLEKTFADWVRDA